MIYNRTKADIELALSIRKKLQNEESLSVEETEALEKGTLTINTLNRIENKCKELKEKFNEIGYWGNGAVKTSVWENGQYFKQVDFDKILENLKILKNSFFVYFSTPSVLDKNYRKFETINSVEHTLSDLERMIADIKSMYRICGEAECGGD